MSSDASQLSLSPLRGLTTLRDAVSALSAVIRCPEEEAHQRAALAALDTVRVTMVSPGAPQRRSVTPRNDSLLPRRSCSGAGRS